MPGFSASTRSTTPLTKSTTSGCRTSSTSCCRHRRGWRVGWPTAQSGCSAYRVESGFTISGSTHSPNRTPRSWARAMRGPRPPGSLASSTSQSPRPAVSSSRGWVTPEPAVVEQEELRAEIRRVVDEPQEPVRVEGERGGLPVVHHDRPQRIAVAHGVPSHPPVEATAQGAHPLGRPGPDLFGGDEGGTGVEHVLGGRRVVPAPDPHRGGGGPLEGEADVAPPGEGPGEDGPGRLLG